MPRSISAQRQRVREIERGIRRPPRRGSRAVASGGNRAGDVEIRRRRAAARRRSSSPIPASPVTTRCSSPSPVDGGNSSCAVVTGLRAGADRQRRDVLVELERARRRGIAGLEVVPRPALSQPAAVERAGIADDVAVDAGDAGRLERGGPFVEQRRGAVVAAVDGRDRRRRARSRLPLRTPSSISASLSSVVLKR